VVEVNGTTVPIRRVYAEVEPGAPVAVVGSTGFIEIAVRDGSAATQLAIGRGTRVVLGAGH
jgi:hypothetical protein